MDVQSVTFGLENRSGCKAWISGGQIRLQGLNPGRKKVELQDLNNKYGLESIKYDMRGKSYVRLQPETVYVKPELLIKKL